MHTSLIFIPTIAYILLLLIFVQNGSIKQILEAFVKGNIVVFTFIAVSTEILSCINKITFPAILTAWLLFILALFLIVLRRKEKRGVFLTKLQKMSFLEAILCGAIAFILFATFAAAILYPPNNWDSMTYHMARVANWINNKSVSFYPTAITRQNYQMPLAEYAIMHIQIITGGDLYANLVQWLNFFVLICLGPLVASELGLSSKQQYISAFAISTIPMAILQASSTQNDLVVASFLMSFSLFMLRLRENLSVEHLLFAAFSLGLTLLTKGTSFIFSAAVGISLAVPVVLTRKDDFNRLLKAIFALSVVVIIALLLNTGHFLRNYNLYGHPLSTEGKSYINEDMTAVTLFSNILRNGALHLGTPSVRLNKYLYSAMKKLLGLQLDNPKTTWRGERFRIRYSLHEDTAGNLIHLLTVLLVVLLLTISWVRGHYKKAIWYAIGITLGTFLYCWILKWNPWASRLQTPLFALCAPLLAIGITSDIGSIKKHIGYMIILCMVVYSLPFVLANKSRSLVSLEWKNIDRMNLYFKNRSHLFNDYNGAINAIEKTDNEEVGLYLGGNDWEYPFWVLGKRKKKNGLNITFRHVGVTNVSKTINENMTLPQYIIATKSLKTWKHASKYFPVYKSDSANVFIKSEEHNVMQNKVKYNNLHLRL